MQFFDPCSSLRRRHRLAVAASVGVVGLLSAGSASAAVRYASPASSSASAACAQATPCPLASAITSATPGDEIVINPGAYTISTPLVTPNPVAIHGAASQPAPVLTVAGSMVKDGLNVGSGSFITHVEFVNLAATVDSLDLSGAVGDDLVVRDQGPTASGGNHPPAAVDLLAAPGTVLRNSSVYVSAPGKSGLLVRPAKSLSANDGASIANVTVVAAAGTAGTTGVQSTLTASTATLTNVIARGVVNDLLGATQAGLVVDHSNFRPSASLGYTDAGANQSAEPAFVDRAAGNLREAAGSPTIDAGAPAGAGTLDPDGNPRTLGAATDIGAFEYVPPAPPAGPAGPGGTATPGAGTTPVTQPSDAGASTAATGSLAGTTSEAAAPGAAAVLTASSGPVLPPALPPHGLVPMLGRSLVVTATGGAVRIKPLGARSFVVLAGAAVLPLGSLIDSRRGRLTVTTALDTRGHVQSATMSHGMFTIVQPAGAGGMAEIQLRGGSFSGCPRRRPTRSTTASTAKAKPSKVIRQVWASDHHGKFRTRGRDSVATVRGTRWITQDRCDGTVTKVLSGAVRVQPKGAKGTVLVKAGHRYLSVRRPAGPAGRL